MIIPEDTATGLIRNFFLRKMNETLDIGARVDSNPQTADRPMMAGLLKAPGSAGFRRGKKPESQGTAEFRTMGNARFA
jgi:hypothetical protein